ncbi:MAG: ribosomal-processing cysteine protease Prp [Firmicutes bacterium]|nr:ribosomal-processing cysteine protease Prp [Bacillota bacterium]
MVNVQFFYNEQGEIIGFEVEGHAEYAPYGEDIVCAALSVLAQTTVLGLQYHLPEPPDFKISDGFVRCFLPERLKQRDQENAKIIVETMRLGMETIQKSYPRNVKVFKRRWTA